MIKYMRINSQNRDLESWIQEHEEEMIGDIETLVNIPSIAKSGNEKEPYGAECKRVLNEMMNLGEKYGFDVKNHGNRCVSLNYGDDEKEIGIWGHLDVVPAGKGWIYSPFKCSRVDDFLVGRGVQDNKGPIVAMLYAMRYLKEKKFKPSVKFRQILGCQEETEMEDIEYYLTHEKIPEYSFVTDCSFPVCCGEKGIYRMTILSNEIDAIIEDFQSGTVVNAVPEKAQAKINGEEIFALGVAGHSAFPDGTSNAIGKLCKKMLERKEIFNKSVWEFLMKLAGNGYGSEIGIDSEDEISGKLTCNLGVVKMQYRHIEAEIDIRYPITENVENIRSKLVKEMEKAGFTIVKEKDSAPNYLSPEHFFVKMLMESYKEITEDNNSSAYVMGGGTYARKIPRAVGFGPGLPMDYSVLNLPQGHGNCHSADEIQSIKKLQEAIVIYVKAMEKISDYFLEKKEDNK